MLSWSEHVKLVSDGKRGLPLVEVLWKDAAAFAVHNWSEDVETTLRRTVTVGYLVADNDDTISLVALVNETAIGHGIVIPKSDIVWWRDLT